MYAKVPMIEPVCVSLVAEASWAMPNDQIHKLVAGHQRVGRFDVAVHQAVVVGDVERRGQLLDHPHRPRRAQRALALQDAMHVDTVDDRHYQIQPAVDLPGVINRDDVRFGQPGGGMGFTSKPLLITRRPSPCACSQPSGSCLPFGSPSVPARSDGRCISYPVPMRRWRGSPA